MEMEQLLDVAIDAFRKIYTDEPWFSWAGAWLSGHDRTAATAENLALSIETVLGSQPPSTRDRRTNAVLILRMTALNLTRSAAMVSRFSPISVGGNDHCGGTRRARDRPEIG